MIHSKDLFYIVLSDNGSSLREASTGTKGRNLEAGTEAGYGGVLASDLLAFTCSATCLHIAHVHLPRDGTTCSGLDLTNVA